MSDKYRRYKEFLKQFAKDHLARSGNDRQRPRRFVSSRQRAIKKRRQRRMLIGASVITLIALVVIIVLNCKSCVGSKSDPSVLQGVWHYDQYTEYEFDGKGSGCMCIEETNHYEFTYTIDGDTLKIDFALDYVTDCEYDFKLENDKLTLIGGKGTANPGQEYTLERVR